MACKTRLSAALAITLLLAAASWQTTSAQAIVSDVCATPSTTVLKANASTVTRGVFSPTIAPVAHIQSGEIIIGECVTQRGSNDYAKLIKGDPGVEDIFFQATGSNRSNSYNVQAGNGGHILTGPIQVCGAKAGDVLKVEILALDPRKNPSTGKCYGANTQGTSGYPAQVTNTSGVNFTDSAIIIYDVIADETGQWGYPVYQFMVPSTVIGPDGKTGGQVYPHPVNYGVPGANGAFDPSHLGFLKRLAPANALDYGKNSTSPIIGASSGPPSNFGGNIDNWRIGAGVTIYYKVQVDGGLLSFGDCHAAEGDSELSGNAIEASLTGTFRITTLPEATLPAALKNMKAPVMETKDYILVHGFAYNDYISELTKPR
ncbi:hypothetical protein KFL_005820040 [Klebsormidium nitens]|uniref:Acetamidase/formamidase n=1 Tax=Klebsormidium nitens TaxID=105231 RepID=A0A1Y1IGH4_KLENI|nr:hypothetical protein KFL_005820040 [Klebsormidium nitens]|eukprot:GAQ89960.1 hypothetical protein KFL_005820040 [Klebsormidium nitens]